MGPDLAALLATPRPGTFDVWVDLTSPDTARTLLAVDLDGRRHGGLPFRFAGKTLVRMRHLPADEVGHSIACGIEAARAWALDRMAGNTLVRMDYDLPWTLALAVARKAEAGASPTLSDVLSASTRQGDWLTDFIAENVHHPAVVSIVDGDRADAAAAGIGPAPVVSVSGATIPAQEPGLHDRVAGLLH